MAMPDVPVWGGITHQTGATAPKSTESRTASGSRRKDRSTVVRGSDPKRTAASQGQLRQLGHRD